MFGERKPMPKGWKNPLRQPLYQVVVERTSDGVHQVVGPAIQQNVAEELAAAIRIQIAAGNEKSWSNPTVIRA